VPFLAYHTLKLRNTAPRDVYRLYEAQPRLAFSAEVPAVAAAWQIPAGRLITRLE